MVIIPFLLNPIYRNSLLLVDTLKRYSLQHITQKKLFRFFSCGRQKLPEGAQPLSPQVAQ